MKAQVIILASIILLSLSLNSCKEEKSDGPSATITELGYNNSGIGYLGGSLNVVAQIIADGKIDNIQVGIHQQNGNLKVKQDLKKISSPWEFDSTYAGKYQGTTDTTFSEVIAIPLDVDTGSYIFSFSVIDLEGNATSVQDNFKLNYGKK